MKRWHYYLIIIFIVAFSTATITWANNTNYKLWNSPRDLEPVVLKGVKLGSFLGKPLSQIYAYSYSQSEDKWTQIPLQIDEIDEGTSVFDTTPDYVLAENDELIFMARDMGDQAPGPNTWIDDEESKNFERFEICVTDEGQQQCVYFYCSPTIIDTAPSYMNYVPAEPDKGNDVISAASYVERHDEELGIAIDWEILTSAGGNGLDILDRPKARLEAMLFGYVLVDVDEDTLILDSLQYSAGKVRVSRKAWYSDPLNIFSFNLPVYYYPYSIDSKGSGVLDPQTITANHIRVSFDLNSNANGMSFYNNHNMNISIDGTIDAVDNTLEVEPTVSWLMATGEPGTVITLFQLPDLGGNTNLYFHDDVNGSTGDNKVETGDGESWGDVGIVVTGSGLDAVLGIPFVAYFCAANQSEEVTTVFVDNFLEPLVPNIIPGTVPVEMTLLEANIIDGNIVLSWRTESEENNYGFEVQRKADNNDNWLKVGFVTGNGSTAETHNYTYTDNSTTSGRLTYRIKQVNFDGSYSLSDEITVDMSQPSEFALYQNFPNPFNPVTKINYQIPASATNQIDVKLAVYNLIGTEIRTLVSETKQAGSYTVYWDGTDNHGTKVTTGTYFYRLKAGNNISTKRMVLMK